MHNQPLAGKTALVTGGGGGIGLAVAQALKDEGCTVYICGRDAGKLDVAASEYGLEIIPCDISDAASVRGMFAHLENQGGGLDILVNNAGYGVFKNLEDTSDHEWLAVINTNLSGAFYCCRAALPLMRKHGGGRIINISSVMGLKGYAGQGAYAASKHGLMGLSKVLGVEVQKDNIIVQVICPGGVDTPMVAQSRPDLDLSVLMQPTDVAQAVCFCLAQEGNAITDVVTLRRRGSAPFA